MTNPATPPTAMAETPLGSRANTRSHGTLPAVAMILASCVSLQFGAALAMQLFPELGSWGVTTLRLLLAAGVLLLVARPRILGWSRRQWMHVLLFGVAIAGMILRENSGMRRIVTAVLIAAGAAALKLA